MADASATRQEADAAGGGAARVVTNASGPLKPFASCQGCAAVLPEAVVRRAAQKFILLNGLHPRPPHVANSVQLLYSPRLNFISIDLRSKMAQLKDGLSRRPVCPPREALQRS